MMSSTAITLAILAGSERRRMAFARAISSGTENGLTT
jgi:hypothetical protein